MSGSRKTGCSFTPQTAAHNAVSSTPAPAGRKGSCTGETLKRTRRTPRPSSSPRRSGTVSRRIRASRRTDENGTSVLLEVPETLQADRHSYYHDLEVRLHLLLEPPPHEGEGMKLIWKCFCGVFVAQGGQHEDKKAPLELSTICSDCSELDRLYPDRCMSVRDRPGGDLVVSREARG
jgi:hypothetical protein